MLLGLNSFDRLKSGFTCVFEVESKVLDYFAISGYCFNDRVNKDGFLCVWIRDKIGICKGLVLKQLKISNVAKNCIEIF